MSWTLFKDKEVKTRKPHRCWGCTRIFQQGTTMNYRTGADGGMFWSGYHCKTCKEIESLTEDLEELKEGWVLDEMDYYYGPIPTPEEYLERLKK